VDPLDERQRREHAELGRMRQCVEASWDLVVNGDLEGGLELLEKAENHLRVVIRDREKVVSIRGPKG
jgi:hypothetical protein